MMQENTCAVFTELKIKIKIMCSFVPFAQDTQVTRSTLGCCHVFPSWQRLPTTSSGSYSFLTSLASPDYRSLKSLPSWPITPCTHLFHTLTLDGNHVCLSDPLVGTPVGGVDVPNPSM